MTEAEIRKAAVEAAGKVIREQNKKLGQLKIVAATLAAALIAFAAKGIFFKKENGDGGKRCP